MPKSPYLVEKFTNALNTLATHPGDARARLNAAFLNVHTLDERDFPQQLQPRWRIFMEEITEKGPFLRSDGRQWKGAVENTIKNMKTILPQIFVEIYLIYTGKYQKTVLMSSV